jgi:WD40 repeat protein
LKVWDAQSFECIRTLQGHADSVLAVAVSGTGNGMSPGPATRP